MNNASRAMLISLISLAAGLAMLGSGCSSKPAPEAITLATTTSMQDSGMLDELLPRFREQTGVEVKVIAVGSGQAMEIGRRGDADVLITHSPPAEEQFMEEGHGRERRPIMRNDFVIVGPSSDPAKIKKVASVIDAFRTLAESRQPFISRGDDSGTHQKELALWDETGVKPDGGWYIEAGVGMAQALRMASEEQAYTLSDRGTFLALQGELDLTIIGERDPKLQNPYSVILVDRSKHTPAKAKAAEKFADFLVDPRTKRLIEKFGVERYGQPLFQPAE